MIPAVIYAAKSTEDTHGSIPTQVADCMARAQREGWEVVGTFTDEAFSAYSGNRGPGLERAKALAARTAAEHGRCILVAQDGDRFARGAGDAPGAADHLGEVYFAMKRQCVELWTDRSGQLDLLRAVIEGERSHDESDRKTQAIKAGLGRRRDERGQPVGAVPIGYMVEEYIDQSSGKATSRRVRDPQGAVLVERMWHLTEEGHTPGQISRTLNAEGARTKRGGHWTTRAVKRVLKNSDYCGGTGYPPLIDSDRWDAIQARLIRLDPAAVQSRKGGRPAADDFLLAGIAFCRRCGAPMRSRRYWNGTRVYKCRNTMEGIGLCDSSPVPAKLAEAQVLNHLTVFVGSVEKWIDERVHEADADQRRREAAIVREREQLATLDRSRERHLAEYRRLVEDGDRLARIALEEIDRIDRDREQQQQQAILAAEAVVAEWTGTVDVDTALDFYNRIADVVQGRLRAAAGVRDLNAALRSMLAGLWFEYEKEGRLLAEFELRVPVEHRLPGGQAIIFDARPSLPPVTTPVIELRAELNNSPWITSDSAEASTSGLLASVDASRSATEPHTHVRDELEQTLVARAWLRIAYGTSARMRPGTTSRLIRAAGV